MAKDICKKHGPMATHWEHAEYHRLEAAEYGRKADLALVRAMWCLGIAAGFMALAAVAGLIGALAG